MKKVYTFVKNFVFSIQMVTALIVALNWIFLRSNDQLIQTVEYLLTASTILLICFWIYEKINKKKNKA